MKLIVVGLVAVLLLAASGPPQAALAQIEGNVGAYTGKNAEGYLKPLEEGFGAALQSGMFRSAAIPSTGYHINIEVKAAFIKFGDADRKFTASTEEGFYPAQDVEAPTVIGDTLAASVIGQGGTVAYFPGGLDIGSLGIAVPQITVSGVNGSQVVLRYVAFDTGDTDIGKLSLFGIGARHSISQYFEEMPVDIAAGFFWQKFKLGDSFVDATAMTLGVQASRQFSVVEPYLSLDYDSFKMSVDYEYGNSKPPTKLSVDFDRTNDLRIGAGVGINLGFLHLQGEIGSGSKTSYVAGLSLGN